MICPNEIDRFSTTNEKAKLNYPVGLLTADEAALAGSGYRSYSEKSYLYTGGNQWLLSPDAYRGRVTEDLIYRDGGYSSVFIINSYGILEDYHMDNGWKNLNTVEHNYEVRPSISLKPGVIIASGDGSSSNPYTLLDNFKSLTLYNVSIESNQVKKTAIKAEKGRRVFIEPNIEGKVVASFKLDDKEVKENSFIMPNKNVVVTDVVLDDIKSVVYESSHYPYEKNSEQVYEHTFSNATSLIVELEYETMGESLDYVTLYDSNNMQYGKYWEQLEGRRKL